PGEWREPVRLRTAAADDVLDGHAPGQQGVRDEASVAAPGHGLGAHDGHVSGRWRRRRRRGADRQGTTFLEAQQPLQAITELLALHVVCVAAEALVSPARVALVRARTPEPAQLG